MTGLYAPIHGTDAVEILQRSCFVLRKPLFALGYGMLDLFSKGKIASTTYLEWVSFRNDFFNFDKTPVEFHDLRKYQQNAEIPWANRFV